MSEPNLAAIRRVVPLALPADAVLLESYQEYSREMLVLAKLRLSHDAAQALVSSLPPGSEVTRPGEVERPVVRVGVLPSWWQPETMRNRRCVRLGPGHAYGHGQLILSVGQGDTATLYLRWETL